LGKKWRFVIEVKPIGKCWCGCGGDVGQNRFFAVGHDKFAEGHVTLTRYGSVAAYLAHHGYGPGGKNARDEADILKGNKMKFFVQMTVRKTDPVDPEAIAQDLKNLGGKVTGNGFGFQSRALRDAAYGQVSKKYGDMYVATADTVS
jgi:hypothetical protein